MSAIQKALSAMQQALPLAKGNAGEDDSTILDTAIYEDLLEAITALQSLEVEAVLDAPALIGSTRFGTGVKWSTVIDRAQREVEYRKTPVTKEQIEAAKQIFDPEGFRGQQERYFKSAVPDGWNVRKETSPECFIIGGDTVDGLTINTAVFEDSEDPVEQLLFAMLTAAQQGGE